MHEALDALWEESSAHEREIRHLGLGLGLGIRLELGWGFGSGLARVGHLRKVGATTLFDEGRRVQRLFGDRLFLLAALSCSASGAVRSMGWISSSSLS